jgi:hypothetical protein
MTFHSDLETFVAANDLELRKITAYWLNHQCFFSLDADDNYTRTVWHDIYINLQSNNTLSKFDPEIAPIHTYMWHVIKNGVRKVESAKYRRKRPTDYSSEIQEDDSSYDPTSDLDYKLDIQQFLADVHGYTCMRVPCNVFKDVLKRDRLYAAKKHRISKHKVSLYLGRIREVYLHYQSGATGIEHWKREFDT